MTRGGKTSELGVVGAGAGTIIATVFGVIPPEHMQTALIVFGVLGGLYIVSRTAIKWRQP